MLQSWIEEVDAQEQKDTGEYLTRALDEDRLSDRRPLSPRTQGGDLVSHTVVLDTGLLGPGLAGLDHGTS